MFQRRKGEDFKVAAVDIYLRERERE